MPPIDRATLSIVDREGRANGSVEVSLLPTAVPNQHIPPLLDCISDPDRDRALPPIQLLESTEYRYEILVPGAMSLGTDRDDVFERDTKVGNVGRLRPGLHTGTMPVAILADGAVVGEVTFEVRSRKLDYLTDFRRMLLDITDEGAEVVMEHFAPAEQRFAIDESTDAETLYQRFAFLQSLLRDEGLDAALQNILARPHVTWEVFEEERRPDRGARASSGLSRALTVPGPRGPAPAYLRPVVAFLPHRIASTRTETTVDNVPNQFVRFALTRWRDVLHLIRDGLTRSAGISARRGLLEVDVILERLEGVLSEELFREVGELSAFPAANQVLQKREGYRDVLRAYLQFELAAKLAWKGGEDIYRGGQRDVAKLYEYWAFLQLARIVAGICGKSFDLSQLIAVDDDGLGLRLREGKEVVVGGSLSRLGRRLRLELVFNKTFRAPAGGSWSTELRPDCSLEVRSEDVEGAKFEPVWLHFDAKYRIESLKEVMDQVSLDGPSYGVKRDDILKMHAYRDAIRRSAGAYVLFPGDQKWQAPEYRELLPGLGAFPLRPSATGPSGASTLARFLEDVLDHVSTQITQHERGRYWNGRVYERRAAPTGSPPVAQFLRRPPADTRVLLGFVRGPKHLEWILTNGLYNLRATGKRGRVGLRSRELDADVVILYGNGLERSEILLVRGAPELHTKEQMLTLGYPGPSAAAYYCIPIRPTELGAWDKRIHSAEVLELRRRIAPELPLGWPVATTWLHVVEALQ